MSKKVILKPGKEVPVYRKHPWIFSGAIDKMDKGVRDGDRVDIKDHNGEYLATGHYQGGMLFSTERRSASSMTLPQTAIDSYMQKAMDFLD